MPDADCLLTTPTAAERPWRRVSVRAPRSDETYVAAPPLAEAARLAASNGEALSATELMVQGRSLPILRRWTRQCVLEAARRYTGETLGLTVSDQTISSSPGGARTEPAWYVGGHQPTLFHPGVWIKNFVVSGLARADGGVGLNLIVDNDTLSGTAVRVPTGRAESPRLETVLYDAPRPTSPWEEARVVDAQLFRSFPDRVRQALSPWGYEPLLTELWHPMQEPLLTNRLADRLSAARGRLERQWGAGTLELPLSRLCELEPFHWFAAHLLAHLPRFHETYNQAVHEYRQVNRVRSPRHPVPDLATAGDWLEAPFWVWRAGDTRRGRVLARQSRRRIELSDGASVFATLPLTPEMDACCAVKELTTLAAGGVRFRTRALTTTLFVRLCLADLFVHGLGGAKYDEITDRLMCRFFRLPPPSFLTLSATVRLPLREFPVQPEDAARLWRQLRELDFHSERHLAGPLSPEAAAWVAEKQRLVAAQQEVSAQRTARRVDYQPAGEADGRERYRRLQEVNRRLAGLTQAARGRLADELSRTTEQLSANEVLGDREYAYCLYPAEKLRRFVNHVCSEFGA